MGIKGLIPFLKSKCTFNSWPIDLNEPVKAAIDVPIFAHKFIYTERTYKNLERKFLEFAQELQSKNIDPIFVFDGAKLELKDIEREKRSVKRSRQEVCNNMKKSKEIEAYSNLGIEMPIVEAFEGILKPTQKDYDTLMTFLESNNYRVQKAKYEAEALCAHLVCTAQADVAITEDTDAIAFGSKKTLFKYLGHISDALFIEYDSILKQLDLTEDQFLDLCCMFGCDFCENVFNIGPEKAYSLIKKHGSWPNVFDSNAHIWPEKTRLSAQSFYLKYEKARECLQTRAFELETTEAIEFDSI